MFEGATITGVAIGNGAAAANGRDFGAVDLQAAPPAALVITIANPGSADLTLGTPALNGPADFSLVTTDLLTTLTPATTTSFAIGFAPTTVGQKSAIVTLTHDGSNTTSPFTFALTGLAISGGLPEVVPDITISGPLPITEGNIGITLAVFNVSLGEATSLPVSVEYLTSDGTATAAQDYLAASGLLTFNPGQTSRSIEVSVYGDTTVEPDEDFQVTLFGAVNGTLLTSSAMSTILNDDVAGSGPSYIRDVQPIFDSRCVSCHPGEGGLNMTSYSQVMASGKVVPGDSAASKLYKVISGGSPRMPPSGSALTAAQIKAIKDWIDAGSLNN